MDLSPAQSDVLALLVAAIEPIEGVEAIWLSRSLASGDGDEHSDVDFHIADAESTASPAH